MVDQHSNIFVPHKKRFLFFSKLFPSQGFKWLGSLSNLSFRRSADKSTSAKSSPPRPEAGGSPDCGAAAVETTVDDMEAMRPRTASYVRSSDNYTHMGTLPRLLMKRRDKSGKGEGARVTNNTWSCLQENYSNVKRGTISPDFEGLKLL